MNLLFIKKIIPSTILTIVRDWRSKNEIKTRLIESQVKASEIIRVRQNGTVNLEIGSGEKKGGDNCITLDLNNKCDLYWDLLLPLPFPQNSIDMIYSSHVLEHFYYEDLLKLLNNCYEVLKKGGKFSACVPDASIYINTYMNPDQFDFQNYCKVTSALHSNSPIDYINYIAYMNGHHRYMFDSKNLIAIIQKVGFKNVRLREFDPLIDSFSRDYESIYAY